MNSLETIVKELEGLSSDDRKKAESYIHDLKKERLRLREEILKNTHGALAGEKGDFFERAIEDCECVDATSW